MTAVPGPDATPGQAALADTWDAQALKCDEAAALPGLALAAALEQATFAAQLRDCARQLREAVTAQQPAPGHLLVARGTIALRDAEIELLREQLAKAGADRDGLRRLLGRYERITTTWTRGMYCAWIDCVRGDVKAAIECLAEGLDGYDGPEWDRTETGAQWWERTKAEEGL